MTDFTAEHRGNRIYLKPVPEAFGRVAVAIDKAISFERPGKQFMVNPAWSVVHLYNVKSGSFPYGVLGRVKDALQSICSVDWPVKEKVEVRRESSGKLRPYQRQALDELVANRGGILQLPTGAGKTITAIEFLKILNLPALIVVHTKDLKAQWEKELRRAGVLANVGLYQNRKTIGVYAQCEVIVFDECHHVSAKSLYTLATKSRSDQILVGLSATPWREDGMDMLIEAALGSTVFSVTRSYLIDNGYLARANVVFMEPSFERAPPMTFAEAYQFHIVDNESRNDSIVHAALTLVGQGRQVIILVQRIDHGEKLAAAIQASGLAVKFIHGTSDNRTVDWSLAQVIIASQVFNEGVDFPSADALIIAGGGLSSIRVTQQAGRVLRLYEGKKDAIIVDFVDWPRYLKKHYEARRAILEKDFEVIQWSQVLAGQNTKQD